ncbi:MAG: S8 family serine peptidase [Candidatus Eisenbacteria bacterium]|nr:S8 family serine peptidase [Candidatus Eisenbacteria bacterium]
MRQRCGVSGLVVSLVLVVLFLGGTAWGSSAHGSRPGRQTPVPTGRVIVKFTEASGLYMEGSQLLPASAAADRVGSLVRNQLGDFTMERHFSRDAAAIEAERLAAESRAGRALPNLNRYVRLVPAGDAARERLLEVVQILLADPAVKLAFLEPVAVPAALGFSAFPETESRAPGPMPRTPEFTDMQGYLDPAPTGIDAEGIWGLPNGHGETVKVLDIEGAWLWDHEDLPDPFFTAGGEIDDTGWRNHGTAVVGEIRGIANSYGVTGIAYEVEVGGVSIAELSVADAINVAAANLEAGDIYLIELHAPGPNANGQGQYGYVCMEFWQDNFDAIQIASANGRICCEAAGNGQQDLDDPVYMNLFDRDFRDSGAIICGATNGASLDPAWFTNYGSRVDLHGWGYDVVTCGYGNLQGGSETEWYTDSFSGTSSASPIVVGAVAGLQGLVKAEFGIPLNAKLARDILVATGTPQNGSHHIGPRPNLTAAWDLAEGGVGAVAGTLTESGSGLPVADARVEVEETDAFAYSAADGTYQLPLLAGGYTLTFQSFFHNDAAAPVIVESGETTVVDLALDPTRTATIGGTVYATDAHTELEGVRVMPLDVPISGTTSGPEGAWSISGFPIGRPYSFTFDNLPEFGADFHEILVGETGSQVLNFDVQLPYAAEDFESGDGGFSPDPIWEHGTPTAGGPAAGFSGAKCWGVGMHANYGDNVFGHLISPSYDFSAEDELYLSFHYWSETETGFDGANVQVWNAEQGDWVTVSPLAGYSSIFLGGLDYEPGWSGSTGEWRGAVFDLTDFISSELAVRFQFGSDGGVTGPGFWVDDVAFDTGDQISAVGDGGQGIAAARLAAHPNPFHPSVQIRLSLPAAGDATLGIYDISGRQVRELHAGMLPAGETALHWDGLDERGHALGSGVYFIRLTTLDRAWTRRIVLAR